jgi:hypothetical protein
MIERWRTRTHFPCLGMMIDTKYAMKSEFERVETDNA